MAFKPLGGKTRRYLNTITGEEISRRQYVKLMQGANFEQLTKRSKEKSLAESLARPARGRTKTESEAIIEARLEEARRKEHAKSEARLSRKIKSQRTKAKPKRIRSQLLKAGHRAERISFTTYEQYLDLMNQIQTTRLPNGTRLVYSYGLGIVGYDERNERTLGATLYPMQSVRIVISEEELDEETEGFLQEHLYFMFSHWFLHVHFDPQYAREKDAKARQKRTGVYYERKT